MQTIRTEKYGEWELRLLRVKDGYTGVVNRLAGGQAGKCNGTDPNEVWLHLKRIAVRDRPGYTGYDSTIALFRTAFPAAFDDPFYLEWERGYKDHARALLDRTLPLAEVLERRSGVGVVAAKTLTNLLATIEIVQFSQFLKGPDGDAFVHAAGHFAAEATEACLLEMKAMLRSHDLAKWTIATYLPYLWNPGRHMFLKPEATKEFAERVGDDFFDVYDAALGIDVYRGLLDMVARATSVLAAAGCGPRDNIDVQGFIWMTSTNGQKQVTEELKKRTNSK